MQGNNFLSFCSQFIDLEFEIADLYTEVKIEKHEHKSLKIRKASSSEDYKTLFEGKERIQETSE